MKETAKASSNRLFVYGTLMKRSANDYARRLRAESVHMGAAHTPGRLYLLGYYPGLLPPCRKTERVFGDVFQLRNPARTLRWLDSYEGCSSDEPEPPIYRRVTVPVTLATGETLMAWAYLYTAEAARARWLPEGRFLKNRPCG